MFSVFNNQINTCFYWLQAIGDRARFYERSFYGLRSHEILTPKPGTLREFDGITYVIKTTTRFGFLVCCDWAILGEHGVIKSDLKQEEFLRRIRCK